MSDDDLLSRHRHKGALIDANVLLVYPVGKLDPRRLASFDHTAQYAGSYPLIARLVAWFSVLYTTPNILTELSNLGGKLGERFYPALQKLVLLPDESYKEHYCRSADAVRTTVYSRLGLTDSAIHTIAEQGVLIVTADGPLYRSLIERNLDAININHLIQARWKKSRWERRSFY